MLVGYGLSRAHGGLEVLGSVRPKIWSVSRRAVRETWKVSGGAASSSSGSAEEGGMGGAWKVYAVKRDLSRKTEATHGCQYKRVRANADAPSMTLASSTENFRPSSLSCTCALEANAIHRSSVNS